MILTDAVIVVDDIDVSGDSNQVALAFARADLDRTGFGASGRQRRAGMMDYTADASGFWTPSTDQVTPIDEPTPRRVTIAPDSTPGSPAFIATAVILAASWGGPIDQLAPWSARFAGRNVQRGQVAYYGTTGIAVVGTGIQLGALDDGESITATIHTLTLDATADIELQSSDTNAWTAPAVEDDATVTDTGVTTLTATGVETNTWWRIAIPEIDGPSSFLITLHRS